MAVDRVETLFAFELFVESIRMSQTDVVKPAVGMRLLDFPTLLVYPGADLPSEEERGSFHRGKSCLFKAELRRLHQQLSSIPLYIMLLDVRRDKPVFVGGLVISLAKTAHAIRADVTAKGICSPSAHGEKDIFPLCNPMGEIIGHISLAYKLQSLGASLISHIAQDRVTEQASQTPLPHTTQPVDKPAAKGVCVSSAGTQTEHEKRKPIWIHMKKTEFEDESNTGVFCPPALFYHHSDYKCDVHAGTSALARVEPVCVQDGGSAEELCEEEAATLDQSRNIQHTVPQQAVSSWAGVREALEQLPILSALLSELSQLHIHAQQPQHASTHAHHAAPSASPKSTRCHVCSSLTQAGRTHEKLPKQEAKCTLSAPKKKLAYGLTRTLCLRLQQTNPSVLRAHQLREDIRRRRGRKPEADTHNLENVQTLTGSRTEEVLQLEPPLPQASVGGSGNVPKPSHSEESHELGDEFGSPGFGNQPVSPVCRSSPGSPVRRHSDSFSPSLEAAEYVDDFTSFEGTDTTSPQLSVVSPAQHTLTHTCVTRSQSEHSALGDRDKQPSEPSLSWSVGTDEEEDELGSLGFSYNYHHISELVANQLPGYTL